MPNANANRRTPGGNNVPIYKRNGLITDAGLMKRGGRGVRNGRPYGEQLLTEERELRDQYYLRPSWARKLRRATKRALGR